MSPDNTKDGERMNPLTRWMGRFARRLPAGSMPAVMQRGHAVENYQAEFPQTAEAFEYFLRRCQIPIVARSAKPVGVALMPWVGTPMPWYSLAIAIGLAGRGRRVQLIYDDTPSPGPTDYGRVQNQAIGAVLRRLRRYFNIVRVSDHGPQPLVEGDEQTVDRLAQLNVIWDVRARPLAPQEQQQAVGKYRQSLTATLASLRTLLKQNEYAYWVVPGGVRQSSGLFLHVARQVGLRASTYDAGLGWMLVSTDGVAGHQTDIGRAFHNLWQSSAGTLPDWIRLAAEQEYQRRLEASDRTSFQVAQSGRTDPVDGDDVLIPLNVEWDTAALGRHAIFDSTVDWVTEAVAFILANYSGSVVVRQHPSERRPLERSQLGLDSVLRERFGQQPRLRFVRAEEPISSYDLLQSAALVLPCVSTIAMEAAALGKPVLVSGVSYYSDLGFVWSADTREDYFHLLGRGLRGQLPIKPQQQDKAWLCYYLTQIHNRTWTDFTPQPTDFWRWVKIPPDQLLADPVVTQILTAIDENIPLSLLRHWSSPQQPEAELSRGG